MSQPITEPDNRATAGRDKSDSLRIAVCLSQFHPTVGGAERQLLQLARRWASAGHRPTVFTRPIAGLPARESVDAVDIYRSIRTWNLGPLFGVSFVSSLVASLALRARRFDVILAGQAPWEAVATGVAGKLTRTPAIVRVANAGPFGDLEQLKSIKGGSLLAALIRRNQAFLGLSEQAEQVLIQFGCRAEQVFRITNGVDTAAFAPPGDTDAGREQTVLFVGRLAAQKAPEVLLEAWGRIEPARRGRLLIAGGGPLGDQLRQSSSAVDPRVEYLGICDDMPALYRRAGLFVLPSRSEGCSNALLEAMAAGLCPIVSNVGGNIDVVKDGTNGRVFAVDDAEQLGRIVTDLLEDHPQRRRLAAAARSWVIEHHSLDVVADRYIECFRSVLRAQ